MASLKYRCLEPGGVRTIMKPVAASQKFYHNGAQFVYLDGNGHVTVAVTATTALYGYAIVPNGRGAGSSDDYWQSSATAGADKIAVIPVSEGARFLCPADDTVTVAMQGNACDIALTTADGSQQVVDVGTSTTDVLLIDGIGTDVAGGSTTDVIVKMNPAKVQADT